jgi:hypothetical protein
VQPLEVRRLADPCVGGQHGAPQIAAVDRFDAQELVAVDVAPHAVVRTAPCRRLRNAAGCKCFRGCSNSVNSSIRCVSMNGGLSDMVVYFSKKQCEWESNGK